MSQLLIDCLKENLDPELASKLETDETLRSETAKYINDLLVNDQLLSTDLFASTSSAVPGKTTLTEEIAELDLRARQIDMELARTTNENRDLIINVSQDLKAASVKIHSRLDAEIDAILVNIRDMHVKWDMPAKTRAAEKAAAASNSVLFDFDSVLDVLELPTLCKLCILQGNYQEALEISMTVKMLIIKFPTLQTFRMIEDKIKAELQIMVKGLIKLLNTNLKQSSILKIFQILNRPDLLNIADGSGIETTSNTPARASGLQNRSLKVIFLNSRFKFITSELASLKPLLKLKKVTYLKRCIETYREHLSNSLSIYRAIFHSVTAVGNKNEDDFLMHTFVKSLVKILISELREHFEGIGSANNDDDVEIKGHKDGVVLQLIYLCKSLDKYGLNFESMLTWELCLVKPLLVSQDDWSRNLLKVKKFRS
ncbi:hypothetical protein METBIDRAFT_150969 [Metschnikowia bicuspidata var. bicuspidata NRRL YB-4993]|uniref:Conserved oligomeric Golgi complex subunit 8 n=1 Tax=Metschnikowia bicuspidata var. bicuspidata NRRL YB-4993 TaxID=869754 RepID=A0A1A0HEJ2_9ASCO|nr:hypothetical protein METBIDRAFT_150969 [Metschnikowia bicuspidata var. bicuspidata NRRL YB-4993]OBA22323.1 hypothetical protein METBIDRAFT_150969 [Metschnikowia bicuspidata var. bicuspidata NRRL YB-4993]